MTAQELHEAYVKLGYNDTIDYCLKHSMFEHASILIQWKLKDVEYIKELT